MLNLNIIIFNENIFTNSIGMCVWPIRHTKYLNLSRYAYSCVSVCVAVDLFSTESTERWSQQVASRIFRSRKKVNEIASIIVCMCELGWCLYLYAPWAYRVELFAHKYTELQHSLTLFTNKSNAKQRSGIPIPFSMCFSFWLKTPSSLSHSLCVTTATESLFFWLVGCFVNLHTQSP